MKKIATIAALGLMGFILVGCGESSAPKKEEPATETAQPAAPASEPTDKTAAPAESASSEAGTTAPATSQE